MAGGHTPAAPARKRRVVIGLVVVAALVVAVHVGLGGAVLTAPWGGWAAGGVAVLVVVKIVAAAAVARSATRHRGFGPRAHLASLLRRPGRGRRDGHGQVVRATARVATTKAERYAKQLCSHAAWKARHAEWTPPTGVIEFPDGTGTCRVTAEPGHLLLTVETTDPARLARMREIIGGNVERFGKRDGLVVEWEQD